MTPATSTGGAASPKLRYLSTAAVANRLGVSTRTIRLWAECGDMPAVKAGRQWRIEDSVFSEWLSTRQESSDRLHLLRK
jgi:excisionase family DNA binding protein